MAALVWISPERLLLRRAMLWLDAVGLAAYAAIGSIKALSIGVSAPVAIVMGIFTATMGGVIRDVLAHEPSAILGPEIYITAATLAASITVLCIGFGAAPIVAGTTGAAVGFALRAGAMTRGWQLPHYRSSR